MKRLSVYIILIGLIVSLGTAAQQRVPAIRTPIQRVQPDGDTLIVLLRGDEWQHWMMTEDGWLVRENDKGTLCYLQKDKVQTALVSKRQAHDAGKRTCCEKRWLKRKGINKSNKR